MFLVLSAVGIAVAFVSKDWSWLLSPLAVLLLMGVPWSPAGKAPRTVRRPSTGAAAAGAAAGATGAALAPSWWADGHAHAGDTADAGGTGDGGGGDGGGGDGGGCGGCGGCGCGG